MNVKKTNDKKSNPMRHSHTARLKAFFETFFSRKLVVIGFICILRRPAAAGAVANGS